MDSQVPAPAARPGRWLAFAVVLTAAVMDLMDTTITQVAGPAIRRDPDSRRLEASLRM